MINERNIDLSASRKTDLIKFHLPQLKAILEQEYFYQVNEYSKSRKIVDLPKSKIRSISLWSKDYSNLLSNPGIIDDYNLYLQFTITGYSKYIERNVPNYIESLAQMEQLSEKYGADNINWRFDPIAYFPEEAKLKGFKTPEQERLEIFKVLCSNISGLGVKRCTISFMDTKYAKVVTRLSNLGVEFYEPTDEEKYLLLEQMVDISSAYGIQIYSCASPFIENVQGIKKSSCIDGEFLYKLFGGNLDIKHDAGQRKDCGCAKSIDIGNYSQKCGHNCVYCYANCALT